MLNQLNLNFMTMYGACSYDKYTIVLTKYGQRNIKIVREIPFTEIRKQSICKLFKAGYFPRLHTR